MTLSQHTAAAEGGELEYSKQNQHVQRQVQFSWVFRKLSYQLLSGYLRISIYQGQEPALTTALEELLLINSD